MKSNIIKSVLIIFIILFCFLYVVTKKQDNVKVPVIDKQQTEYVPTYRQSDIDSKSGLRKYVNEKYGYFVLYPTNWAHREFPDTATGAGFRPIESSPEIASEVIVVDERGRAIDDCKIPFDEYVKTAGPREIQNYETLDSIKKIVTRNGINGYVTTWIIKNFSGDGTYISNPITYFNDKSQECSNGTGTVQISLADKKYLDIYNQITSTFQFVGK